METNSNTISRLKFIGKIKVNEKINVKYLSTRYDGVITKIIRTLLNQDTRENALSFFTDTIRHGFEIIDFHLENYKDDKTKFLQCVNIYNDLKNSLIGIRNFQKTYIDDTMFCCNLETLHQETEAKIDEILRKYPDIESLTKKTCNNNLDEKNNDNINDSDHENF